MKLRNCFLLLAVLANSLLVSATLHGQTKEDPAHQELRDLLSEVKAAYDPANIDKVLPYLDENVVITWQNAKVTKGHKEVKSFFEEMTKGANKVVEKSTIKPEPSDLSVLYNDGKTAVAWGHSKDHYVLTDGTEFDQDTRWSATVVKDKDGKWKVASMHISVNLFANPILDLAMRKVAIWVGSIAAGGGLLLGLIVGWFFFRTKSA